MYRIGLLSSSTISSIRDFCNRLSPDSNEQVESDRMVFQEALQALLFQDVLKPLSELCVGYSIRNQQLIDKDKFDSIANSPYHLLGHSLQQARSNAGSSSSLFFMNQGLLATILEDCILHGSAEHGDKYDQHVLPQLLEHVQSGILQQMAKTGLDLISKSIGR